jgi:4-hydroxy-tetrahydrodipicolinate reductase
MVIGTTGFAPEQVARVQELARQIPCVLAPNMSMGVNVLFKVVADVARLLGDDFDVEIVEAHHRFKKDAPSGTALKLAQNVADALGRDLNQTGVYARHGLIGERTRQEIGIQTVRAGDIVGEHTVIFASLGERIEITHRAHSRDNFARGAIRAAIWVVKQPPGLYNMQQVLGIK